MVVLIAAWLALRDDAPRANDVALPPDANYGIDGISAPPAIAATTRGRAPFWSPDGRTIAFFAGGALLAIPMEGGATRRIAPVSAAAGGTWNRDDVIVYSRGAVAPRPACGERVARSAG